MRQEILSFFGSVILYGGGGAAIAYLIFKQLGESWLDSKFKEKLAAVEHAYAVELQRLKQRLDTASSGVIRLHQKEFEVLPEAYGLLDQAMGMLQWVNAPFQQYVKVSHLTQSEWAEFVEDTDFGKLDKASLSASTEGDERQTLFNRMTDWQRMQKAEDALRNFHNYTARNSIFLPEDLRSRFDDIRAAMWEAKVAKSVGIEAQDWKMQGEGWTKLEEMVKPKFEQIRTAIHTRLNQQAALDLSGLNNLSLDEGQRTQALSQEEAKA